jgi:RecA-family ATPase
LGYLIGPVRYDTLSTSKTTELVRALDKREQRPWLEMLSAAARLVTFSVETTAEFVDLRKSVRSPASRWAVKPITPALKPSVLYADGGSGKSTLAVAICMSVASGIEIVPGITPEVVGNAMHVDWVHADPWVSC